MDYASYFIENKAIFGSFPTQKEVENLEDEHNTRVFVDVTHGNETKTVPYTTKYNYISYPIDDSGVPTDYISFAQFIIYISNIITKTLKPEETIYIHCKGGHGRSGLVVACLLTFIRNICPKLALEITNECHNNRLVMKDRWRTIGAPQTYMQKRFVIRFFSPLFFYQNSKSKRTYGFSNFAKIPVIMNYGVFPTAEAAIQATKNLNDINYVNSQISSRTPQGSKSLGDRIYVTEQWKQNCELFMFDILKQKFDNNQELKFSLINTGLRDLVYRTKDDLFWGKNNMNEGENRLGKVMIKLREMYYINK